MMRMRRGIILVLLALAVLLWVDVSLRAESIDAIKSRAEQEDAEAQLVLGMAYIKGEGVLEDRVEALEWLRKAAE